MDDRTTFEPLPTAQQVQPPAFPEAVGNFTLFIDDANVSITNSVIEGGGNPGEDTCVEEGLNCWAAGFCYQADVDWGTGLPDASFAPATEAECIAAGSHGAWLDGADLWAGVGATPQGGTLGWTLSALCASN